MYLDIYDKESNLSSLTFQNVAFPYMQQTYFHLIMSLHLLSFPKNSCITAGKAMECRMNRAQIRPFHLNDSPSFLDKSAY